MTKPYPALLSHILDGERYGPLLDAQDVDKHRADWRELFVQLAARPPLGQR